MALQKGDYVLLDYTILTKDDNRIVQTTNEEIAKQAGIYSPDNVYEPVLVIVGETKLLEPVEEALLKAEEGQELTVEVPPEKGFGERDPKKVKTISIREFYRIGKIPKVGDTVEIDGQQARVIDVSSGRVTLDFNHPLAGKTLIVRFKVVKKLEKDEDKIRYLIKRILPHLKPESISVEILDGGKIIKIRLPVETLLLERIGMIKASIAEEISRRFPNVEKIIFEDVIELKRGQEQKTQT
ncbi:MAG: peptidylprolyl isomerase [Crenarchaeota archaeon]|nr:peptidylprolyl isomerase [Thermoproteota archaeon]